MPQERDEMSQGCVETACSGQEVLAPSTMSIQTNSNTDPYFNSHNSKSSYPNLPLAASSWSIIFSFLLPLTLTPPLYPRARLSSCKMAFVLGDTNTADPDWEVTLTTPYTVMLTIS